MVGRGRGWSLWFVFGGVVMGWLWLLWLLWLFDYW